MLNAQLLNVKPPWIHGGLLAPQCGTGLVLYTLDPQTAFAACMLQVYQRMHDLSKNFLTVGTCTVPGAVLQAEA